MSDTLLDSSDAVRGIRSVGFPQREGAYGGKILPEEAELPKVKLLDSEDAVRGIRTVGSPHSLTFVTSFFHIYESDYDDNKTIPWRVERFREMAELGIKLCVYISPEMEHLAHPLAAEFPHNVKIMKSLRREDTFVGRIVESSQVSSPSDPASSSGEASTAAFVLPSVRNETKDTTEYLITINCKTEFMADAIENNPWNSTHFAWIDFNISHVFFKKPYTMQFLKWLGSLSYFQPSCFVIPGCWSTPYDNVNIGHITETVNWRFCGGFFLGDKASILKFHALYKAHFPTFLETYRTLVWEVNFWAWLEQNSDWHPQWYQADHNDSIICDICAEVVTRILEPLGMEKVVYDYPEMPVYCPSSAAYLHMNGKHYLNTRYVNYRYFDSGYYMFHEDKSIIRNKNYFSELHPENLTPKFYAEMEETIDLPKYEHYSRGIEDIRLYEYKGKLRYLATTVGYFHTAGNRMVVGDYCLGNSESLSGYHFENTQLVESPLDHYIEKNWIPLIVNNEASRFHQRELFIYRWSPLEIGELCGCGEPYCGEPTVPPHAPSLDVAEMPSVDVVAEVPSADVVAEIPSGDVAEVPSVDVVAEIPSPETREGACGGTVGSPQYGSPHLHIIERFDVSQTPFFYKMKGSTLLVDNGEHLVGIVHFTEDTKPRHYFNMMILLDRTTLEPLKYSDPFCFERVNIEFCLGFSIVDGQYLFWISRMDRDPVLIKIDVNKIPIYHDFFVSKME